MSLQFRNKSMSIWLLLVISMVYGMILVGGLTRLTDSGLSMVDWRPIMGTIPPITAEEWQSVFDAYRQFPEYQQINKGMSLDEFKSIFYWEYGHRVLGRLLGIVFFIPFLYFVIRGRIRGALLQKLGLAFVLGGAQGLLGWYMVKSGLVNEPRVSQYRLAAHLGLAFLLLCYLYWIFLDLMVRGRARINKISFKGISVLLVALISLQIFYGALTAGLDAGLIYNTFPHMNGVLLPDGAMYHQPAWKNLFENPMTVQFIHRCLGWMTAALVLFQFIKGLRSHLSRSQKSIQLALLLMTFLQFILGVGTLLMRVPLSLASLHQGGAAVLLVLAVSNCFIEWRYLAPQTDAS